MLISVMISLNTEKRIKSSCFITDFSLKAGFRFAIDRGGTFTDVYARCPSGKTRILKLLSEDPSNYLDAPREGIRRILQEVNTQNRVLPKEV